MSPGPWQIVIIAVVILVLFGASRLGDIGKGLGEGIRNFKKGIADDDTKGGDDEKKLEAQRLETEKKEKKKDETSQV